MAKYDYGGGCPCGLYRDCLPQCENYSYHVRNETIKGNYMTKEKDTGDFGFTLVGEDDIATIVEDTRAERLRDMIMPFLTNLRRNPEKDYIQWPGIERIRQIDSFIKKIDEVMKS